MVIWYVLRSPLRPLARPCIFDASISCSQNPISPEDVIERTGFFINLHVPKSSLKREQHCRNKSVIRSRNWRYDSNSPFAPGSLFDQNTEEQGMIRDEGHSGGRGFSDLLRLGEGRGDTEVPKRQRGSFLISEPSESHIGCLLLAVVFRVHSPIR